MFCKLRLLSVHLLSVYYSSLIQSQFSFLSSGKFPWSSYIEVCLQFPDLSYVFLIYRKPVFEKFTVVGLCLWGRPSLNKSIARWVFYSFIFGILAAIIEVMINCNKIYFYLIKNTYKSNNYGELCSTIRNQQTNRKNEQNLFAPIVALWNTHALFNESYE